MNIHIAEDMVGVLWFATLHVLVESINRYEHPHTEEGAEVSEEWFAEEVAYSVNGR
jgi:hypothetical protein